MTAAGRRRPSRQSIRGRVFVALLLMIAAASLLDRYLVVRQVQVDGLIARSADAVLALSGVRAGDSLFRLNEHA
ncbi:MAG: hypothetical protein GX558_10790, partial [Clostridiales bacterium]|nr:hypothetical protein [Clostridiales bacterium]